MNKNLKEKKSESIMFIIKNNNNAVSVTFNPNSLYAKEVSRKKSRKLKFDKIYISNK